MEALTEFDVYMNAMKQINLNESAIPLYKGKILVENADEFRKILKLLNCDKMENSHMWLYDLDVENLDESEKNKINNLYKLGCAKGYIEEDEEDKEPKKTAVECDCTDSQLGLPVHDPAPVIQQKPTCAYTAMYSAVNPSGEIKTGEAYSNAISPVAAKLDIIGKLEKAGYHNITILCIEVGDTSCCGTSNVLNQPVPATEQPTDVSLPEDPIDDIDAEDVFEDDSEVLEGSNIEKNDENVNEEDESNDEDTTEEDSESKEDSEEKEDSDDSADEGSADDDSEDKKEEKVEEPDEKLKDDAEKEKEDDEDSEEKKDSDKDSDKKEDDKKENKLSASEKSTLKDSYKKAFKAAMIKCKFEDKSFDDLTLNEKIDFFTALNDAWKKEDPTLFMDNKELEALEKIVVKK